MTKIAPYIKVDSAFPGQTKYRTDAAELLPPKSFYRQEGKEGETTGHYNKLGVLNSNHRVSAVLERFIFSLSIIHI